jgi:DNA-binding MarR family transcriptional regulator
LRIEGDHVADGKAKPGEIGLGLTIPQIVILRAIRDLGEVPTNRLSAHSDLTAATVITILDRLEERGLVTRRRGTEDRRIVYTRLTPHGAEVINVAPPMLSSASIAAFAKMPEARRRRLLAGLNEVANLLDIADEQPLTG